MLFSENQQCIQHKFKTTSQWLPKQNHHIESLEKDLHIQPPKSKYKDNHTKGEGKAVNNPRKGEDIIITKANKGGAVVIIDVVDYINEANC